jgi:hypothetical protein
MQAEDIAGNSSLIVTKINWTYDEYINIPTLTLATTTASRLVNVEITNDNEAVAWLLGEGKNAQPMENDPGWRSTRPTAVYLSSAEAGVKWVYLWVRDAAGNATYTATSIFLTATSTSAQLMVSILSPQSGQAASATIYFQYNLSQPVDPGSLRLVFIHSSGANDPNSPHIVTKGLVASEGVHNVSIKGYDLNMDGNQTSSDCLVDGAVYSLILETTANTSDRSQINNLKYDISPPIMSLISPANNGSGREIIQVRYQASEPLAEDSLQLVFYRLGQEAQTVTTLIGGMYIYGNDLNNDGTITTEDTLINGATYTICFQASDLAGNRAAPVYATNWTYDITIGIPTLFLSEGATYTNSSIVAVKTTEDSDIVRWLISETQKVQPAIEDRKSVV